MKNYLMVVDDDPDILISIRSIFENIGYEVLTVDCGKDCIKELKKGFKGIILMDLMMPFMDGYDTINEIIRNGFEKDVKISILTSKGSPEYEKICKLKSFIYDYITKPFDVSSLIFKVRQMVAN